jgi:hypothetical protein
MKITPTVAVLLLGGLAQAQAPDVAVTKSASDSSSTDSIDAKEVSRDVSGTLRIELRDTLVVSVPGTTAAFSVDPSVAEVSTTGGRVTVAARSAGTTTISLVTQRSIETFLVIVAAPARRNAFALAHASSGSRTVWQGTYESGTDRLTNSLELVDDGDQRVLRAYAVTSTRLDNQASDGEPRTSLPALALEWRTRRNELVLFDKTVEHSPLTLNGVTVRGLHVRYAGAELHAGITSPLLYQGFLLETQRAPVLGASYEVRSGRSSFTPSVYGFPSAPEGRGTNGAMGSMMYRYATMDDRFALRGELGYGGVLGSALELSYRADQQIAWLSARHQPDGFAGLTIARPSGSMINGLWSAKPNDRLTVNVAGEAARYEVNDLRQDVATATTEARVNLVPHVAASAGVSAGRFAGTGIAEPVSSITVPVGLHYDQPTYGASAVYRYQRNTARNDGGHGGRLGMRAHRGSLHASAFADIQQDAATVELILREQPALAQLLNELGLTASSPEELARLLRENATLAQLGLVDGINLEFNPLRTQVNADVAWLSQDDTGQQLRLRFLLDRTQTVSSKRDTTSVMLSYARRLSSAIDVTGALSWWSRDDQMTTSDTWLIAAGLRVRINDVPRLGSWWRRKIDGVVVNQGRGGAPVPGVTLRLDGGRTAVSDRNGQFVFDDVRGGEHRVEAEAPVGTYFTGPSRVVVSAGGSVRFDAVEAPARLNGTVIDDLAQGIAGVQVVLLGHSGTFTATTDSRGHFSFAVVDGDYQLETSRETIPAGYDASAASAQSLHLDGSKPVHAEVILPANRSIAGTVHVPPGASASIKLVGLDRSGTIDDSGRYVFRGLKPGKYTVEAVVGGQTVTRLVELPAGPAAVHDIDFP